MPRGVHRAIAYGILIQLGELIPFILVLTCGGGGSRSDGSLSVVSFGDDGGVDARSRGSGVHACARK